VPTFKITLEYDGTKYHGWQIQPNLPTIQAIVQSAILTVTQQPTNVIGAGRTDAGVHALGQVASFHTAAPLTGDEWLRAINGLLPDDIVVLSVEHMPDSFHARFSAHSKLYRYRILHRPIRSALDRSRLWHVYYPLNLQAVQSAAAFLLGTHDFSSFQGSPTDTKNPVCHLTRLDISRDGDELSIDVEANRFLKQMVRNIVGTLVEVGRGKLQAEAMIDILAVKDRTKAGPTAPGHGLYLLKVEY
jgi:tRNA pseudouridine38-40 synthase